MNLISMSLDHFKVELVLPSQEPVHKHQPYIGITTLLSPQEPKHQHRDDIITLYQERAKYK